MTVGEGDSSGAVLAEDMPQPASTNASATKPNHLPPSRRIPSIIGPLAPGGYCLGRMTARSPTSCLFTIFFTLEKCL